MRGGVVASPSVRTRIHRRAKEDVAEETLGSERGAEGGHGALEVHHCEGDGAGHRREHRAGHGDRELRLHHRSRVVAVGVLEEGAPAELARARRKAAHNREVGPRGRVGLHPLEELAEGEHVLGRDLRRELHSPGDVLVDQDRLAGRGGLGQAVLLELRGVDGLKEEERVGGG